MYPFNPDRFWTLTPKMVWVEIKAADNRRIYEHNLLMKAAYYTILPHCEKPPRFEDLMIDNRPKPKLTDEEKNIKALIALEDFGASLPKVKEDYAVVYLPG